MIQPPLLKLKIGGGAEVRDVVKVRDELKEGVKKREVLRDRVKMW